MRSTHLSTIAKVRLLAGAIGERLAFRQRARSGGDLVGKGTASRSDDLPLFLFVHDTAENRDRPTLIGGV